MLSDIIIGRAHQELNSVDLHRHAQISCKPSMIGRASKAFWSMFK